MDQLDIKILNALQDDASLSIQDIANKVGLSSNPCWRRIKKLEDDGVIAKRVALIDPNLVNLGVTVFVFLKTENHSKSWLDMFSRSVAAIDEIVECHRLSGANDYLLKIQVSSIDHYDSVYKKLVESVTGLTDVSSSFSMEKVKYSTSLKL
ncbi:Lrp/AsnC family transcriptional regulator [Henriciella litoralis]|uniref:Lrp/AsnC family transcriptional regulator n=1 Tax=Henriciella litoralis TaxID=568102 RepID=UPI000A070591